MKPVSTRRTIHTALKSATRRQIRAAGGVEAAASVTRVGKTELSNYQSEHSGRYIPVDVFADLMIATGSVELLETVASLANYTVFPNDSTGRDLTGDIVTLAENAATLFHDFARECAKNDLPESALLELEMDLARVVAIAMHARAIIRSRLERDHAKPDRVAQPRGKIVKSSV